MLFKQVVSFLKRTKTTVTRHIDLKPHLLGDSEISCCNRKPCIHVERAKDTRCWTTGSTHHFLRLYSKFLKNLFRRCFYPRISVWCDTPEEISILLLFFTHFFASASLRSILSQSKSISASNPVSLHIICTSSSCSLYFCVVGGCESRPSDSRIFIWSGPIGTP